MLPVILIIIFIITAEMFSVALDNGRIFLYNIKVIGVWRSLVSRLVRVQEASGSNPDTPTIEKHWNRKISVLFLTFAGGFEWGLFDYLPLIYHYPTQTCLPTMQQYWFSGQYPNENRCLLSFEYRNAQAILAHL